MTDFTSAEITAIFVELVIVLLILRRSYAMARGVPYSAARLAVAPTLILVLWGLSELESLLLTPWAWPYLIAADIALLVLAMLAFTRVAERMTEAARGPSGEWTYRIGLSIAALFVGAFLARLVAAVVLFPSSLGFVALSGGFPPSQQQVALVVIDALFSLSAGLLLGRSWGVVRKVRASRAA